ncbi:hypothetical protein [Methylobacterium sp. ID0610]|uniref:hypothetical protein n=1 Tax=Methylobacterium carpenticola TaxID=3344827 RepID=UPI0036CD242C
MAPEGRDDRGHRHHPPCGLTIGPSLLFGRELRRSAAARHDVECTNAELSRLSTTDALTACRTAASTRLSAVAQSGSTSERREAGAVLRTKGTTTALVLSSSRVASGWNRRGAAADKELARIALTRGEYPRRLNQAGCTLSEVWALGIEDSMRKLVAGLFS